MGNKFLDAFDALAFLKCKEIIRLIDDAKMQETRDRRFLGIRVNLSIS